MKIKILNKIYELRKYLEAGLIIFLSAYQVQAAFKDNGWGVRSSGMGGAFTALADDASATSWNPGAIVQVQRRELIVNHERLFMGLDSVKLGSSYASLVIPTYTNWSYGLSWENLVSADQYSENTIKLSIAAELQDILMIRPDLSLGVNLKMLEHKFMLDEYNENNPVFDSGSSKSVFSADVGLLFRYTPFYRGFSVGIMAKNITQPDIGLKNEDIVPMELRFATAFFLGDQMIADRIVFENITPSLEVSLRDSDMNLHFGWESWFMRKILGVRFGANLNEFDIGFSYVNEAIRNLGFEVDYSFRLPFEITGSYGSHKLGLTFRFGPYMKK